jgi:8-oxo-dGTP pyrophosphatase MutT (NUDIX family)
MSFEPQKFFIGLIDFFSILLPGALLTYMVRDDLGPPILGHAYSHLGEKEGPLVFLFASYLLGHFIFLLGAWLLDDFCYASIRNATRWEQIKSLSAGGTLPFPWFRRLARFFFKSDVDFSLRKAEQIKEHYLSPLNAKSDVNTFQWSKARLTLECPEAQASVQRFEADSKFFRSLVVVLLILIPWSIYSHNWPVALGILPLMLLAFWRYIDQRSKSTSQAYWLMITKEASSPSGYRATVPNATSPTHAGGVVHRRPSSKDEYLLVEATRQPGDWVLPKGHIDVNERAAETAVREVREEAGIWASIRLNLGNSQYAANDEAVRVQFFLMEVIEEGPPTDAGRAHRWLTFDEAMSLTRHDETRTILSRANRECGRVTHSS